MEYEALAREHARALRRIAELEAEVDELQRTTRDLVLRGLAGAAECGTNVAADTDAGGAAWVP